MASSAFSRGDGILYAHAIDSADQICVYGGLSGPGEVHSAGGDSVYVLCEPGTGKISPVEKMSGKRKELAVYGGAGRYCAGSGDYGLWKRSALLSAGSGYITDRHGRIGFLKKGKYVVPLKYTVQKSRFMIKF